jgi:hypothetical protein
MKFVVASLTNFYFKKPSRAALDSAQFTCRLHAGLQAGQSNNVQFKLSKSSIDEVTAGVPVGIEIALSGIAQRKLPRIREKCHWFADQKNPARTLQGRKARSRQRPIALRKPSPRMREGWPA